MPVPPEWMRTEECVRESMCIYVSVYMLVCVLKMESRLTHTYTRCALIRPEYETVQLT